MAANTKLQEAFFDESTNGPDEKMYTLGERKMQLFAELIVQECILIIQKGISLDGNTTEKFLRTMKHLKDIKEHFGIEEWLSV